MGRDRGQPRSGSHRSFRIQAGEAREHQDGAAVPPPPPRDRPEPLRSACGGGGAVNGAGLTAPQRPPGHARFYPWASPCPPGPCLHLLPAAASLGPVALPWLPALTSDSCGRSSSNSLTLPSAIPGSQVASQVLTKGLGDLGLSRSPLLSPEPSTPIMAEHSLVHIFARVFGPGSPRNASASGDFIGSHF